MKQKIVMKVEMNSDRSISKALKIAAMAFFCLKSKVKKEQMKGHKGRSKAMKLAAVAIGVISVTIEGPDKDQLVVVGEGVDSVYLTNLLRKKVGHASIVKVEEVKEEKKDEKKKEEAIPLLYPPSSYIHYPIYEPVYHHQNPSVCSIM